jgi:hemerythrin
MRISWRMRSFWRTTKKFRVNYKPSKNKPELLKEFHGVLIKWLVNHILKIDMRMKKTA